MKKVSKLENKIRAWRSPEEMRRIFKRVHEITKDVPPVTLDHEPTREEMQERMREHSERWYARRAERKLRKMTGEESE